MWGTSSMDRVPDFESVGSGFESQVPHHIYQTTVDNPQNWCIISGF